MIQTLHRQDAVFNFVTILFSSKQKSQQMYFEKQKNYSSAFYFAFVRALKYFVSTVFWNIAMFSIVLTLCLIAIPKQYADSFACWAAGASCSKGSTAKTVPFTSQLPNEPKKNISVNVPINSTDIGLTARLAIESSKEKYDTIKDVQDRLFSLIAAMAALLAFLGFKGVESYMVTKQKAIDAASDAEKARVFLETQYPVDNRNEIAIARGAALRDIADCYVSIKGEQSKQDEAYLAMLTDAKNLLYPVAYKNTGGDKSITIKSLGTLGNIYYRLNEFKKAYDCVEEIFLKYDPLDPDAHFNAACYLSRQANSNAIDAKSRAEMLKKSLQFCSKYIKLEAQDGNKSAAIDEVQREPDLEYLRVNDKARFDAEMSRIEEMK